MTSYVNAEQIKEVILKGRALTRKELRELNVIQQLVAFSGETNPGFLTLRFRGEVVVTMANILKRQMIIFTIDVNAMRDKLYSKMQEVVKIPRVRRSGERKPRNRNRDHGNQNSKDSRQGTPIQRMLRKATPDRMGINSGGSSQKPAVDKRINLRRSGDSDSDISNPAFGQSRLNLNGLLQSTMGNNGMFDQNGMDDIDMNANMYYDMPGYSDEKDLRRLSGKRVDDQSIINDKYKELLSVGDMFPVKRREPRGQRAPEEGRNARRKQNKNKVAIVDKEIQLKKTDESEEETMEMTMYNKKGAGDATMRIDDPTSYINVSNANISNFLKAIDHGEFQHEISMAKEFQKSYYQSRSLLKTPVNEFISKEYKRAAQSGGMLGSAGFSSSQDSFQKKLGDFIDQHNGNQDPNDILMDQQPDWNVDQDYTAQLGVEHMNTIAQVTQHTQYVPVKKNALSEVEQKVDKLIQKNMKDGEVNFNKLITKERIPNQLKATLFYQVLTLGYRMRQDKPEIFSDITITRN